MAPLVVVAVHSIDFNEVSRDRSIGPCMYAPIIKRNEEVDRPEKDWESNKGRAVIDE